MTTIRPIRAEDEEQWRPLWEAYLSFYRHEGEPPNVFPRLVEADSVTGLLAFPADTPGGGSEDRAVGLVHLVIHPSTWSDQPVCYLADLYVERGARGGGTGRALIDAAYATARERDCREVYWHTQEFNAPARSLYETVASLTSFRTYEKEL